MAVCEMMWEWNSTGVKWGMVKVDNMQHEQNGQVMV